MTSGLSAINSLEICLRERRVGLLNWLPGDRHIFVFDESYINDRGRPTLSLSFKGPTGLITSTRIVNRRLLPFFSNLLPEGHLRDYLAQKAGVSPEREFYLLTILGEDLPGAITARPVDGASRESLAEYEENQDKARLPADRILRFSLAGVRLKFSAVLETHGGLTIPAHGTGGGWIVKLPSSHYSGVPQNEYAMLELARAIGIQVPAIRLVSMGEIGDLPGDATVIDGQALAIERFDRTIGGGRVHTEDFAQVFDLFSHEKYGKRSCANIARVLWAETGEEGTYEFVRRLVFSVLIGNADMHLKNWSLLYPDGRTPALSPAYDFVSTIPYIPGDTLALSFGGTKSMDSITAEQIRRFAERAGLPLAPVLALARDTVARTLDAWEHSPHKHLIPPTILERIDDHIRAAVAVSSF